jgi:peptide/nickel transport system permease protein
MSASQAATDAATATLLEVENLSVSFPSHYGEIALIQNVSFALAQGETLGLVGESGSGKTVLGQALLGLLPKTARITGRITIAGIDVLNASPRELTKLRGGIAAPIFQDALISLNPNRTVAGHFADIWRSSDLSPRDGWRDAAEASLRQVALRDPARVMASYPFELSGGMRQRALIALALLRKPTLLVADEPTTALDRLVQDEVLATLDTLQRDMNLAVILISHDLDVIRRVCARTAVLYAGQLCELGPTADVLSRPLHRYTAGLIGGIRSLQERQRPLLTIPGVVPPPGDFGAGCRFMPRCANATPECGEDRPYVSDCALHAWCHHPTNSDGAAPAAAADAGPA